MLFVTMSHPKKPQKNIDALSGDGDEALYDAATLPPPVPKPYAASGRATSHSVSAKVNPFGSSPPAAKPEVSTIL